MPNNKVGEVVTIYVTSTTYENEDENRPQTVLIPVSKGMSLVLAFATL